MDRLELFVDGEWKRPQNGNTVKIDEAATGEVLGESALAGPADVDVAVAAARRALVGPWRDLTVAERAETLRRFGVALKKRGRDTTVLVSRENGMPIATSTATNGFAPAMMFDYYADLIEETSGDDVRPHFLGGRTLVQREPVGVVAAITPWNYPHSLAAMKIAPALAAGCTVVFKPSPETALDGFVFADVAEEIGLPPGVLNVIPADRDAGTHLVAHPGVDKVAFTGSTRAGRTIGRVCGEQFKPVSLELGGKSAAIVTPELDVEVFLTGLLENSFANNGQTCHASTRILLPRRRYDEYVEAITESTRGFRVGNPLDKATQIGPLVSAQHRLRVLSYIELGRNSGARLTTGGGVPDDQPQGWFVSPTVFADVDNSSRLAREEIFGPVICLMPYDDLDQAVEIANDSEYGLAGMVWTPDEQQGRELAQRVNAGTVGVNIYGLDLKAPFGGRKGSGMGVELGPEGLAAYYRTKSVYFPTPLGN